MFRTIILLILCFAIETEGQAPASTFPSPNTTTAEATNKAIKYTPKNSPVNVYVTENLQIPYNNEGLFIVLIFSVSVVLLYIFKRCFDIVENYMNRRRQAIEGEACV